jgi:hypothetical protein
MTTADENDLMQVEAVVFDFDGLLMDTESTNLTSSFEVIGCCGGSVSPRVPKKVPGGTQDPLVTVPAGSVRLSGPRTSS